MPTEYTAGLYHGEQISLKEFALQCAGMHVVEPFDAFRPDRYHRDAKEDARKRLDEVEGWSDARVEEEVEKFFNEGVRSFNEIRERKEVVKQTYEAMLKQVEAWNPTNKDHKDLKMFMIAQLIQGLAFDCENIPSLPQRPSNEQYHAQCIKHARQTLAYHTKEYAKEVRCARNGTRRVRALLQSLDGPE